jgi:polyhydroxyalkanoate synthase
MFALIDTLRQMQGHLLERFGLRPIESSYRIAAAGGRWRLRAYGGAMGGPPLLIVSAPIKRPYIWDLAVSMSVVRHCLQHRLRVYLLEWLPPSRGADAGLADYSEARLARRSPVSRRMRASRNRSSRGTRSEDIGGDFHGRRRAERS